MTELAGGELYLPQRPHNQVGAARRRRNNDCHLLVIAAGTCLRVRPLQTATDVGIRWRLWQWTTLGVRRRVLVGWQRGAMLLQVILPVDEAVCVPPRQFAVGRLLLPRLVRLQGRDMYAGKRGWCRQNRFNVRNVAVNKCTFKLLYWYGQLVGHQPYAVYLCVCECICVSAEVSPYCSAHDEWLIMKLCMYVGYHDANNL